MRIRLTVTAGPHAGREFNFDGHDTFLVGRGADAHLHLSRDDPYFSRRHFLIELNPPRCRVLDLNSRNGTHVNGQRVTSAELRDGDEVRAGHTVFRVAVEDHDSATPAFEPAVAAGDDERPVVPGYAVGDMIGKGGMGVVYRATRLADGLTVALKTITPAAGTRAKSVKRFVREAEILRQLTHKHIVGFHDAGEANGRVYLAMEYVDGPSVERVVKQRGPMAVPTAVRLTCQVLDGLAHAHSAGFVHRDIKPGNILLGGPKGSRVAKLADFGLARAADESMLSGVTMQGEVGGTPAYMAPEQVTHFRDAGPAADQYAVAATLYRLLTGRTPHDLPGDVLKQLVHIATAEAVPIRARRPDLPLLLADVVHTALSREPIHRFDSATDFRGKLATFG